MNPIKYLDAYTMIFDEKITKEHIFSIFSISKVNQKKYHFDKSTITFPIEDWSPNCEYEQLEILYEDETILAVNKPPFLLVHSDGSQEKNMQDLVNTYLFNANWPHKAQAIHRLDKETSGILLFCKNPFFQSYYDRLFAENHPIKEYYAIVKKNFPFKEKEVLSKIGRDRHNSKKMRISDTGKESKSIIHRVKLSKSKTLLNVKILTGRKHQIRVHLSSLGFPIINDNLYGEIENRDGLLLQHYKISFTLPEGNTLYLEIPIDKRLQKNLK